jgi:hypothetical protein
VCAVNGTLGLNACKKVGFGQLVVERGRKVMKDRCSGL